MSDTCLHESVVESRRFPDGSIDGRCEDCGEDGFPLRDVAYERFIQDHGVHRCSLIRMAEEGLSYTDALAASLSGKDCDCASCRDVRKESP